MIYPWQEQQWQKLAHMQQQHQMPHALLLGGPAGTGRADFAETLARSLLCQRPGENGYACGECGSCKVMASNAHPDFTRVTPPEGKKQIPVDRIRELNEFLTKSRSYGRWRVAIINPAAAMNQYAANSLLKTLEEPAPETVIILVAENIQSLLPTIRSRCVHLPLTRPMAAMAVGWLEQQDIEGDVQQLLEISGNRPMAVMRNEINSSGLEERQKFENDLLGLIRDEISLVEMAASWEKHDLAQMLEWQLQWLHQLARQRQGLPQGQTEGKLVNLLAARTIADDQLWQHYDVLMYLRGMTEYPLNRVSLNESMLSFWHKVAASPNTP